VERGQHFAGEAFGVAVEAEPDLEWLHVNPRFVRERMRTQT
jgi:hypothetical protein